MTTLPQMAGFHLPTPGRFCPPHDSRVIDFGDASICEPAGDFVGLCAWQGWEFAKAALKASGLKENDVMAKRIVFMGRCLGLIGVGWANWQDQDCVAVRQRFLQNAFKE